MQEENRMNTLAGILVEAKKRGATDVHLTPGTHMLLRVDGKLIRMSKEAVKPSDIDALMKELMSDTRMEQLFETGELEFAYTAEGFYRLRVNVFRQSGTCAIALRLLPLEIPQPESLGIPEAVTDLAGRKKGLVLVTGEAGSGRSTTLASFIGVIANTCAKTIITLEEPIEYVHPHGKSMVIQREIGSDSRSCGEALKASLRQDPDVILVGEMRDLETISTVITAAEMGHLVFSTLHINSTAAAIDRMIEVFPTYRQHQVRMQLADVLEGIVAQQLLPRQDAGGRIAAFEVLIANPAIRNLIREGKAYQIPSVLQKSRKAGMQTMDDAIYDLYMKSHISSETAISYSRDLEDMQQKIRLF